MKKFWKIKDKINKNSKSVLLTKKQNNSEILTILLYSQNPGVRKPPCSTRINVRKAYNT